MALHTYSGSNTCGLLLDLAAPVFKVQYVEPGVVKIYAPDHKTFEQFATKEDAAVRARAVQPNFDLNEIFGTFSIEPLNVTGFNIAGRETTGDIYGTPVPDRDPYESTVDVATFEGTAITINSEYTYSSGVLTYAWSKDGHPIPNATNSSLVFSNPVTEMSGIYTCHVIGTASNGSTGEAINRFNLTVHKLPA